MTFLRKFVSKYDHVITEKEKDYLVNFTPKTNNFYGLPKVHKSKIISEQIKIQNKEYIAVLQPEDLKLRPIVAVPNCPTKRLSTLLDIIIKPMIKHVKCWVRYSLDFLNKYSSFSNQNKILATFNIASLYTNIPHEYGIEAISYWIGTYPDTINSRFPKAFIIEGLSFVLINNIFHFNDEYFQQLKGTAMGTDVAPTYSTLTVGYSEVKLYNLCEQRWELEIRTYVYENWSRFLDDCEFC